MNKVRCAIYTRKSSEEGLEQGFNSLDAQREACAAYILSQASEGWQLIPEYYDDGGISGGTLERPALQRMLADIRDGRIDIVVVYKVDRLTRSLLDFSKLVETFDGCEVSFVSVTQSFNTTTSMGRLTLNMLLSFAQFEREVTAERIRDKLAASKAKGMWMGGTPPLGYRPDGRSLAIVPEHAQIIGGMHRDYLSLGSVRLLADKLIANGVASPVRIRANGKSFGGGTFSRGQLYSILRNPIYAGHIAHRGKTYPGLHPAIIDRETWDLVQQTLAEHRQGHRQRPRAQHRSLLSGLIVDGTGQPMLASHAARGSVRYRYYVSKGLQRQEADQGDGLRLPAREIEMLIKERVAQLLDDPLELIVSFSGEVPAGYLQQLTLRCEKAAHDVRGGDRSTLVGLLAQVRAMPGRIEIDVDIAKLADSGDAAPQIVTLTAPFKLTRTGLAIRVVQADGSVIRPAANLPLAKLVARARQWWGVLAQGEIDISQLAEREKVTKSYVTRMVRAAFLSPQVIEAILAGRQRPGLDATQIRLAGTIPADWDIQRQFYL